MAIEVFSRYEKKYLLDEKKFRFILDSMQGKMIADKGDGKAVRGASLHQGFGGFVQGFGFVVREFYFVRIGEAEIAEHHFVETQIAQFRDDLHQKMLGAGGGGIEPVVGKVLDAGIFP